jgi:hypothetical protein
MDDKQQNPWPFWPFFPRFGDIERIEEAGDGNRTHVTSLEGWSFTIKLRPRSVRPQYRNQPFQSTPKRSFAFALG